MNDVEFMFDRRNYPIKYINVRISYSKSDERIILKVLDRKRNKFNGKRESERLDKIYDDLVAYFRHREDCHELIP